MHLRDLGVESSLFLSFSITDSPSHHCVANLQLIQAHTSTRKTNKQTNNYTNQRIHLKEEGEEEGKKIKLLQCLRHFSWLWDLGLVEESEALMRISFLCCFFFLLNITSVQIPFAQIPFCCDLVSIHCCSSVTMGLGPQAPARKRERSGYRCTTSKTGWQWQVCRPLPQPC